MSGWLNRDTNVLHAHDYLVGTSYYQRGVWSACRRLKVADPLTGRQSHVVYVDGFPDGARRCDDCVRRLTNHRDNVNRWLGDYPELAPLDPMSDPAFDPDHVTPGGSP